MIHNVFAGMLENSLFAYLYDLIIASKDPETHLQTLQVGLQRLQEAGIKVKLSKYEFPEVKFKFLGH